MSGDPGRGGRVRLDIGELNLHGFSIEHRERFAAALQSALEDLMASRGAPGGATARPPAPIDALSHQASVADPEVAARETARAIWGRLSAPPPRRGR